MLQIFKLYVGFRLVQELYVESFVEWVYHIKANGLNWDLTQVLVTADEHIVLAI